MAITQKTRFEVFKRDFFTCQYCGNKPPSVVLEVDHIIPKSKQGEDVLENLITSCFACNRGKSNRELSNIPTSLQENLKNVAEKETQIKEYEKFLKQRRKRRNNQIERLSEVYTSYFPAYVLADTFKLVTVNRFLDHLTLDDLIDSMHIACSKIRWDSERSIKYFCGICWQKIRLGNK